MTHLIRMPGDTFSSDPHEYLTQTSSVCWERWRAKLCHSFTTRRRRTYLYFWISSREGSVWNLIHKHYSPDSPVFPLPEEKKSEFFFWATLGNFSTTQSSFRRFNTRADWDLAPAMFHQTHLSSAIAGPSVSHTAPREQLLPQVATAVDWNGDIK